MNILAGIDEAGLGPSIGPLATGCAALSVPNDWRPDSPWEHLSAVCCREWRKKETRLGVADSKELYKTGGLAAFENTLAAFSRLANNDTGALPLELPGLDSDKPAVHPCYSRPAQLSPLHCAEAKITASTEELRTALNSTGAAAIYLAAAALHEPILNRRFAQGLNKNQALLMETGRHLVALAAAFPNAHLWVVVDKQGGRNDYLPFLTALFPGSWLETLTAGAERSAYRIRRSGGDMEIHFNAKGDRDSFATALASLAAKYTRERAMADLNEWFCHRWPSLKPTAGYPTDAKRWLAEVRKLSGEEARLDLLIRER